MATCLIGLGSNLGDRQRTLDEVIARLDRHAQVRVIARSGAVETRPAGGPAGQTNYLNAAALIETSLDPRALLALLKSIEAQLGRQDAPRWAARPIDLDLLLYGRLVLETLGLVVPHPRLAWRRFVLEPAAQIAAEMLHPTTGWTIARLLEHLDTSPWYVAITGSIGSGKTRLAGEVASRAGARLLAETPDHRQLATFYADPPSHAWAMELEFLAVRRRLLANEAAEWWEGNRLAVSDFWFGQSAAFARVWLPTERLGAYLAFWQDAAASIVRPRLTVLLTPPGGELLRRVRARGRPWEQGLTQEQLERIGASILDQTRQADQGPVMRLGEVDDEAALAEVLAAIEAMK